MSDIANAKEGSCPDLAFLSDRPTGEDQIGIHKEIASNLKKIVMSELPKPFVVGLFGSWGTGKSSIVKMLVASKDRRFAVVVVDAWRKDRSNFLRQFTKKLAREILPTQEAADVCKKVDIRTSTQETRWVPGPLARAGFVLYLISAVLILGGVVFTWVNTRNYTQVATFPLKEVGTFAFLVLAAIAFQWFLPRYSQQIQERVEEISLEDPAWFRKIYFEQILNRGSGVGSGVALCVVIDNLDRVSREDALAIIKFVKTFVVDTEAEAVASNKTKVTFLVPFDDSELLRRIQSEGVESPKDFLEKFVNVSVRIPAILEQDNIRYIRNLILETGLTCPAGVLENVAFSFSRACRGNPRKPKVALNHFVARFNLAKNFPDCWRIIKERVDWFAIYSILESEFPNSVPESIEQLKLVSRMAASAGGDVTEFLQSVSPIVDEISPEAWHTFRFLKRPNTHDLIPGFRELFELALSRKREDFQRLFFKVLPEHPYLARELWIERDDLLSRMAVADALLWSYKIQVFEVAGNILKETAALIQMRVPGWTRLAPGVAFDLILESREECLRSVLEAFITTNYEQSEESHEFLHLVFAKVLERFSKTGVYDKEIKAVLERRGKEDGELATLALGYPRYATEGVFMQGLELTLRGKYPVLDFVEYVREVLMADRTLGEPWLVRLFEQVTEVNDEFYSAVRDVAATSEQLRAGLVVHFDQKIAVTNLDVISELEALLKKMELVGYRPNESQGKLLRRGKDSVPCDQLTEGQKDQFAKFFGAAK